jgi:superfamily II DNA or RNA helicase
MGEMNQETDPTPAKTPKEIQDALYERVVRRDPNALQFALPAMNAFPDDGGVLLLSVTAALVSEKPEHALRFLQRFAKYWRPFGVEDQLLRAIALAQQGHWTAAAQLTQGMSPSRVYHASMTLPTGSYLESYFQEWVQKINAEALKAKRAATGRAAPAKKATTAKPKLKKEPIGSPKPAGEQLQAATEAEAELAPLPRYDLRIPLLVDAPASLERELGLILSSDASEREAFRLRFDLTQLDLMQGFDELLCLPMLKGVETFWYQLETVRKVLKQFRGRVLLADEVGLGKTIEAGMVLKEYLMRGMAERVLALTPATLVGQWQEEMSSKFGVEFASTYDSLVRSDPRAFWSQPRVIASIATARRAEHQEILAEQHYDLVIVDEAHHLKNRATANWKLVNGLKHRFLLLLSATPVQNSLVELFNLLTLLKPGIFKTEKEFRASYMMTGKPRVPANRETMRDLMRDVMIRNTRSLVDVKLPPRHAATMRLEPREEEAACYRDLSQLVQESHVKASVQQRMALRHLLSAAGSTATTAAGAIGRYINNRKTGPEWIPLLARYEALMLTGKEQALLELISRNPLEKKMVFVHHRETLARLSDLARQEGHPFVAFDGSMSGPEKDAAVAHFRDDASLLFCTESGGEGRNLQFCNTLINFDLPWNPMIIEQRIGRVHRIGQTRDVFIFNLAMKGTLEDKVLRILDEKINMFELVVGEIGEIMGELSEENDFADLVFSAWIETTEAERETAFEKLGDQLVAAKQQYQEVKALDEELFGEEFVSG